MTVTRYANYLVRAVFASGSTFTEDCGSDLGRAARSRQHYLNLGAVSSVVLGRGLATRIEVTRADLAATVGAKR